MEEASECFLQCVVYSRERDTLLNLIPILTNFEHCYRIRVAHSSHVYSYTEKPAPCGNEAQRSYSAMQELLGASLVRIRTVDGGVIGAGFLVGEQQILTCAHVVSQA